MHCKSAIQVYNVPIAHLLLFPYISTADGTPWKAILEAAAAVLYAAEWKLSHAEWSHGNEQETASNSSHHSSINCGDVCGLAGSLAETPDKRLVGVNPARIVSLLCCITPGCNCMRSS